MNTHETAYTRRQFIGNGLLLASAATTLPSFLDGTCRAMAAG